MTKSFDDVKWGISAFSHDAAISVFKNNQLVFATHSERWSKKKNDSNLCPRLLNYIIIKFGEPSAIYFYENPLVKLSRQLYAGQGFKKYLNTKQQLKTLFPKQKIHFASHHKSHAAAGFFTSGFDTSAILVIDAIGEWTTTSIWKGEGNALRCIYIKKYPQSLGLWYSAFTKRVGLKPNEEEYIFMGMAALGDPQKYYDKIKNFSFNQNKIKRNFHRGCEDFQSGQNLYYNYDVAAACQKIYTEQLLKYVALTKHLTKSDYLVFMGGCALNCVANTEILKSKTFKNIWIMPNPGDAGSSLGAVLAHTCEHITWKHAFLGYEIPGKYPVDECLDDLQKNHITAVACGAAEFGPRALGHRSLLADPRIPNIKQRVNEIKKREPFRPFSPMILEEFASEYFELDSPNLKNYEYMQFTAKCKFPNQFPGIVHFDNTSRLQTVSKHNQTGVRELLEKWYHVSGCPMLLNTSLNIKSQPLLNDENDASQFSKLYGVPVRLGKV